jgi:predicted RNase H-like nuclease (RuvC/YqgF family)
MLNNRLTMETLCAIIVMIAAGLFFEDRDLSLLLIITLSSVIMLISYKVKTDVEFRNNRTLENTRNFSSIVKNLKQALDKQTERFNKEKISYESEIKALTRKLRLLKMKLEDGEPIDNENNKTDNYTEMLKKNLANDINSNPSMFRGKSDDSE